MYTAVMPEAPYDVIHINRCNGFKSIRSWSKRTDANVAESHITFTKGLPSNYIVN